MKLMYKKNYNDYIGKKFNKLEIIDITKDERNRFRSVCKCFCGNIKSINIYDVLKGKQKSCGCLNSESVTERSIKHNDAKRGNKRSKLYKIWCNMKTRCNNINQNGSEHYILKGIKYDVKWEKYENFKKDMWYKYTKAIICNNIKNISLERIDNNKNYCFFNCIFIERKNQPKNTSQVLIFKVIFPDGKIKTEKNLSEFCRKNKLNRGTLSNYLRKGIKKYKNWEFEKINLNK